MVTGAPFKIKVSSWDYLEPPSTLGSGSLQIVLGNGSHENEVFSCRVLQSMDGDRTMRDRAIVVSDWRDARVACRNVVRAIGQLDFESEEAAFGYLKTHFQWEYASELVDCHEEGVRY